MIRDNRTEALWKDVARTYAYQEAVMSLQMHVDNFHGYVDNDDFDSITQRDGPFFTEGVFIVESTKRLQTDIATFLRSVQGYVNTKAWAFFEAVYGIREGDILEYTDRSGSRKRSTIVSFHIGSTEYGEIGFRGANIRADGTVGKKEVWFSIEADAVVNLTRPNETTCLTREGGVS